MLTPRALFITAIAMLVSVAAEAGPTKYRCYWVDGRLTLGNGTPALRIWPRGTNRLLGVTTSDYDSESETALPKDVWSFMRTRRTDRVWGSFKVCPLAADRTGWMRPVTVPAARGLKLGR